MTCTNIQSISVPKGTWIIRNGKPVRRYHISVGCGKCMACKINRMTDWSDRLIHELESWEKSCFVTLTYDDDHLPLIKTCLDNGEIITIPTLNKRDPQLWIKRIRKHLEPEKIKYYLSGEYGTKTDRPHYHAIIFGLGINECKTIGSRLWNKCKPNGFNVEICIPETIRYTCKYMIKGLYTNNNLQIRQKPFAIMSQGMGKNWALKNKDLLLKNLNIISDNGAIHPIPRYYRKLLKIDSIQLPETDYEKQWLRLKTSSQREKNALAKAKLSSNKELL